MGRLINTEEFIKRIDHYPPDIRDTAKKELRYCKTVDAVPVVRCKDCKHRPKKDGYYNDVCPCASTDDPYIDWMPEDDWFCANGEKVEQ